MRFAHFQFDPADATSLGEKAVRARSSAQRTLAWAGPWRSRSCVRTWSSIRSAKERFEREAKHTSNLAHPNIATVFEYGQDRGTSFIAMEYLEGRTLDVILKDHTLGYEEGLRIALQMTSALGLVHERGLIHRDLKPANVMVMGDGTVKLLDFGICRSTGESNITQEGMLVGTVLYMSPEQVLGDELDVRTDVFAIGSVLYHAFTGQLPFPGNSFPEVCMAILEAKPRRPKDIRSGFPEPLATFLLRCLERDPERRFPHAGAAYGALLAVADHLRLETSGEKSFKLRGKVVFPPLELVSDVKGAQLFAGGLRRDFCTELERSTELEVKPLESRDEIPADLRDAFLLCGSLDLQDDTAALDIVVERAGAGGSPNGPNGNGRGDRIPVWQERIEHSDNDEWGLQAKMVGSLVRTVKRRLAEYTLAPPPQERRDPARAEALARRAHEILHRGTTRHLMAAMSNFRRAIDEDPGCALAHAGMAEALARKFLYWDGERTFLRESREAARLALAHDPFCAEAHTALGFSNAAMGDTAEAQREYRLAIQMDHEEWLAHRLLGALLGRLGNYEGASPLLQRAIALRPTHVGSYDHLYGVLIRLDRYQEAIELADRGISMARRHLRDVPDDQEARVHLALLLARMGLQDEALGTLKEARQKAPKDAYTCYHSASVFTILGNAEEALKLLKEASDRGFYLPSELLSNSDLDPLRGRPDFQALIG